MTDKEINELKEQKQEKARVDFIEKCKQADALIEDIKRQKVALMEEYDNLRSVMEKYNELITESRQLRDELFDLNIKKKKVFKKPLWSRRK